MIAAIRTVSNNGVDDETSNGVMFQLDTLNISADETTGDMVATFLDCASDAHTLRIPFGRMFQIYH